MQLLAGIAMYYVYMAIGDSKSESFDESVAAIAEKIRVGQETHKEAVAADTERQRAFELEKIRNEIKESYGGSDDADDDEEDGVDKLVPASLDDSDKGGDDYLSTVEDGYKEPVMNLVQTAIDGGISRAVSRAQKKNDPYLIDVFHDSLAHLLHQRMQDQGLL